MSESSDALILPCQKQLKVAGMKQIVGPMHRLHLSEGEVRLVSLPSPLVRPSPSTPTSIYTPLSGTAPTHAEGTCRAAPRPRCRLSNCHEITFTIFHS